MKIYNSISELIGRTPIIRLKPIEDKLGLGAEIYAKLEYLNPTGSVKDRAAYEMLRAAMERGEINDGTVIIEPTSGNTGIGLAAIASSWGLRSIIVMPDSMSRERAALIKAYGGEVVYTPGKEGMAGAIKKALELKGSFASAFIPSQFDNPDNKAAHIKTTGPEIYEDMEGNVDIFVAGVGTGGTLSGVGEYLKSKIKDIKIIAVEPADSPLLSGGNAAPHKIQGIGANFIPPVLNTDIYDGVVTATTDEAYGAVRVLSANMGIAVGISSGAALSSAIKLASLPENRGKRIAVLLPDGIDRYLSCDIFD
ncbi:MAG: cysteine synthase A [Clostridia bacterium]|nr:cysteine synthase A [Clostridia bacterium]